MTWIEGEVHIVIQYDDKPKFIHEALTCPN